MAGARAALDWARLPFGRRARSAERARLSGRAYRVAGVRAVLSRCAYAGALTSWRRLQQNGPGAFARDFSTRAPDVCKNDARRATNNADMKMSKRSEGHSLRRSARVQ